MPTYEYECKTCSHRFEVIQSMSDDALTDCPECGKEIRRLIGGGMGIIFKGSGFYVNDSRSGGKGDSKSEGSEKSGKDSTADTSGTSLKQKTKSSDSGSGSEKKPSGNGSSEKKSKTPA